MSKIDVVLTFKCPSLSKRSRLTCEVGLHRDDKTIHLRVVHNTRSGTWRKDWVSEQAIDAFIKGATYLTAKSLHAMHPGTSRNTAGFRLAAMYDLGLVRRVPWSRFCFERVPGMRWQKAVQAAIDTSPSPSLRSTNKFGRSHHSSRRLSSVAPRPFITTLEVPRMQDMMHVTAGGTLCLW